MLLKRTAAALLAALTVLGAPAAASADYNNDYGAYNGYDNNYSYNYDNNYGYTQTEAVTEAAIPGEVTTAPPAGYDPTRSAGNAVTVPNVTSEITPYVSNAPQAAPSSIYLVPGQMENGEVRVNVNMESSSKIANVSLTVSYDGNILEFVSSQKNELAGGMAVENQFDDKYVYNYVNKDGTDFDGTFVTLVFKVKDPNMVSTVLYLAVTSFDDEKLNQISFASENGIVRNPNAVGDEPAQTQTKEVRTLTVPFRKTPVQLSELGIENIKNCVIEDTSVMTYENGALQPLQEGSTQMDVVFADTTIQTYIANVVTVDQQPTAQEASASVEAPKDDNEDKTYGIKKFIIAGGAALLILLVMVEYLLIMKPGKKKKKKAPAPASEPVEEEDNREMLESLQAAFKKKKGISDTDDK